jgi:hypothetical protein
MSPWLCLHMFCMTRVCRKDSFPVTCWWQNWFLSCLTVIDTVAMLPAVSSCESECRIIFWMIQIPNGYLYSEWRSNFWTDIWILNNVKIFERIFEFRIMFKFWMDIWIWKDVQIRKLYSKQTHTEHTHTHTHTHTHPCAFSQEPYIPSHVCA